MSTVTDDEKKKIKVFLLTLFDKCDSSLMHNIVIDSELILLFSECELRDPLIKSDDDLISFPNLDEIERSHEKKIKQIGKLECFIKSFITQRISLISRIILITLQNKYHGKHFIK